MLLPLVANAQAPANDDPTGAIDLPLGTICAPLTVNNVNATTTTPVGYTNPGCAIAVNPKDVWFRFTTAAAGQPGSTAASITVSGVVAGQVRAFASAGAAGPFTPVACSAASTNNAQAPQLDLRGLTAATTYYVSVSGYGSNDFTGAFTICARVATFPSNDLSVTALRTLTRLPVPQGTPHVVRAVVTNLGLDTQTNVPVTLTVTGANAFTNTQTLPSLAAGATATVSFAGYTPTAFGNNTVTVTTPPDGDNTNNSLSEGQETNATTFSYAAASPSTAGRGFDPTGTYNVFASRFVTNTAVDVTQVRAYLVGGSTGPSGTVGKTVYGAVFNGVTGAILGRSADFVVTAASINTYVPFTLTTPVRLPAGADVYVGLVQTYQPGQTTTYFPLGTQPDGPGRVGAFYGLSTTTATALPTDNGLATRVRYMLEAVTGAVPTATRNEALAAQVSLYPNPARQQFQLVLPAGALNSASATLFNALGQAVQTRQLQLPAAGGAVEFDVYSLAAGIYYLELRTAESLVIKRVELE